MNYTSLTLLCFSPSYPKRPATNPYINVWYQRVCTPGYCFSCCLLFLIHKSASCQIRATLRDNPASNSSSMGRTPSYIMRALEGKNTISLATWGFYYPSTIASGIGIIRSFLLEFCKCLFWGNKSIGDRASFVALPLLRESPVRNVVEIKETQTTPDCFVAIHHRAGRQVRSTRLIGSGDRQ